jgi:hypothetical protein
MKLARNMRNVVLLHGYDGAESSISYGIPMLYLLVKSLRCPQGVPYPILYSLPKLELCPYLKKECHG